VSGGVRGWQGKIRGVREWCGNIECRNVGFQKQPAVRGGRAQRSGGYYVYMFAYVFIYIYMYTYMYMYIYI